MADGDIRTIIETQRLLDDCPFGYHEGHVITFRSTSEANIIAWLQRLEKLRAELGAFISRQIQLPEDHTP